MVGGLIGALVAAIREFIDYLFYNGALSADKPIARARMTVDLAAVVLYAIHVWLRVLEPKDGEIGEDVRLVLSMIDRRDGIMPVALCMSTSSAAMFCSVTSR